MSAALRARWPVPANVGAFTTLRHGAGVSAAPFDHFNLGNRMRPTVTTRRGGAPIARHLIDAFALPSPPRWLRQVHGTEVVRFRRPRLPAIAMAIDEPVADASVTSDAGRRPGHPHRRLPAGGVRGRRRQRSRRGACRLARTGGAACWRTRSRRCDRPPDKLVAWLGPAAGPQAYEIGEEVFDAFVAQDARAASAFAATRPGHWRVDLYALARQRLAALGISRVHGGDLCTISDPQWFFSHRRSTSGGSGRTGRMATVAWIQP